MRTKLPVEHLRELYDSGMSVRAIGRQYGITGSAVWARLKRAKYKMRPSGYPSFPGAKNWNWKGGRSRHKGGYMLVNVGPNRRRLEHRVVIEKHLGRRLRSNEHVHHLNGVRDDNRIANLTLVRPKSHEKWTRVHALQKRIRELEAKIAHLKSA